MKKALSLFVVISLTFSFVPKKDIIFQISKESRNLLVNGDNFSGSSFMFWNMWKGKCRFICSDENVLFVEGITFTTDKKPVYGSSLFVRIRSENRWECIFFIGNESVTGMGGIKGVDYDPADPSQIIISYGNGSKTFHGVK